MKINRSIRCQQGHTSSTDYCRLRHARHYHSVRLQLKTYEKQPYHRDSSQFPSQPRQNVVVARLLPNTTKPPSYTIASISAAMLLHCAPSLLPLPPQSDRASTFTGNTFAESSKTNVCFSCMQQQQQQHHRIVQLHSSLLLIEPTLACPTNSERINFKYSKSISFL